MSALLQAVGLENIETKGIGNLKYPCEKFCRLKHQVVKIAKERAAYGILCHGTILFDIVESLRDYVEKYGNDVKDREQLETELESLENDIEDLQYESGEIY